MKKFSKTVLLTFILVFTFVFTGCFSGPKTFSKAGMSITLTNRFTEKEYISMTAYYESSDMLVTVLKEDFASYPSVSTWSVSKYAQNVVQANRLSGIDIQLSESGYAYFEYAKTVSGNEYSYFATCHKAQDAFWLIQFAVFTKDFEEKMDTIWQYANSITFEVV